MDFLIFYFIFLISLIKTSQTKSRSSSNVNNKNNNVAYNIPDPDCTGVFHLCTDADKERLGRRAVKAIHEQMDDDKDGLIEASESQDFIHEELQSKTDSVRYRRFQNADLQITFDDLWDQWKTNPVFNWTNDDVVNWLNSNVHLSIYVEYFRRNQIDGRMIPRIAANEKQYLSSIMQIRDPRHKRRLIIKATDIVLFGPPQPSHSFVKDFILTSALLISIVACLYAFIRHRKTQENMKIMLKELETLQKAEGNLIAVSGKVKAMETELKDKTKVDRGLLNSWFVEVQRTKEEAEKYRKRRDTTVENDKQLRFAIQEIEQLRIALRKAEEHARHQSYEAPSELIDLLKRTYHIEENSFETKRKLAENAMMTAKDQMGKISKMQKGFFGAVRIAHTGCMDNISELINSAKERLAEVQEEYEEREKRWNRIAALLDRSDLISLSLDSISRSKATLNESSNSNQITLRGISTISALPTQTSQVDSVSQADSGFETSNSPSATLKRRALKNSRTFNEPFGGFSNSTNDLHDSQINSTTTIYRQNTFDNFDNSSSSKTVKPIFEPIPSLSNDDHHDLIDDENLQINDLTNEDEHLSTSAEKARKQLISTKLFKSFQNIRFRKKNSTA